MHRQFAWRAGTTLVGYSCELVWQPARAARPSKPAAGRLEAVEAQIRDEIAVM